MRAKLLLIAAMLAATTFAYGGIEPSIPATPDDVWSACFLDLHDHTEPSDQQFVRYLYAPDDSAPHQQLIDYGANSTSFRSELGHTEPIGGRILKLDLRAFAWDFPSRQKRLAELERRGVKFDLKDATARRDFLDPWEQLAKLDPFFVADSYDSHGTFCPGWLDTGRVNAARQLSRSLKFVLRADWILPKLLLERGFGGIYSDLLMLPAKEKDLFRALLIDIDAVNRDNQLRQGGAVLDSIVALHNRELQLIPSSYGQGGNRFLWMTFDTNIDARGNKSVLESFAGTLKHDGRETIGSLPNGLLLFMLFNGQGDRAEVVPEDIAQIKIKQDPLRETRVINSYSCIKCHGPVNGIYGFQDVVRKAFLNPAARLQAKSKDPHGASDTAALIEDYYASNLSDTIRIQQQAYAARLQQCCGMTGTEIARALVDAIEGYQADLVTSEAAAREQGYAEDFARISWQASRNPQLAVLATGQPLRRAAWEQSFGDAMRAAIDLKRKIGSVSKPKPY